MAELLSGESCVIIFSNICSDMCCFCFSFYEHSLFNHLYSTVKRQKRQLTFRIQSKMSGQIARCCSTGSGGHSGLHINTKVRAFYVCEE